MASPELQALMAQMRDSSFAAMMQQQQTAMEAMLNNERGRQRLSGSGAGYQREVQQESRASLESRRGATGRSNSSQRPRRPTKQRTN